MKIFENGSRASSLGSADYFTGPVRIEPVMSAPGPAQLRAVTVTFEPAARTAWHTHPLGQSLHVLTGLGVVQSWGGPVIEIRPGDTIWFEPGEKHWHGASRDVAMTHLAMQEEKDGTAVTWLEHVSDSQYEVGAT